MVSASIIGPSPFKMMMSSLIWRRMKSRAIITAWPVPRRSLWNAVSTSAGSAASTTSRLWPVITQMLSHPAFFTALITCEIIGSNSTSHITFGRSVFMRVPLPPAIIIAHLLIFTPPSGRLARFSAMIMHYFY